MQYVWEDSAISLGTQYKMAEHYRSLRVFVSLGDTAADIRTAMTNDFQVDPAASAANRAEIARAKKLNFRLKAKCWGCPAYYSTASGWQC